ncbi:MAG: glycosyltransferase family 2 protein, partial [Acidobacteria bacterium]|nr:glycosyltransferase family 2 protein [Acidobacteriota bacterium]
MSAPAVDIVIPCFNGERFLGQTLDSALAQTHPAVHVLVVDDGSTDGTRALVEARGGRVGYLHKENGGQASARNLGIARTAAPYVCLLDAD